MTEGICGRCHKPGTIAATAVKTLYSTNAGPVTVTEGWCVRCLNKALPKEERK